MLIFIFENRTFRIIQMTWPSAIGNNRISLLKTVLMTIKHTKCKLVSNNYIFLEIILLLIKSQISKKMALWRSVRSMLFPHWLEWLRILICGVWVCGGVWCVASLLIESNTVSSWHGRVTWREVFISMGGWSEPDITFQQVFSLSCAEIWSIRPQSLFLSCFSSLYTQSLPWSSPRLTKLVRVVWSNHLDSCLSLQLSFSITKSSYSWSWTLSSPSARERQSLSTFSCASHGLRNSNFFLFSSLEETSPLMWVADLVTEHCNVLLFSKSTDSWTGSWSTLLGTRFMFTVSSTGL